MGSPRRKKAAARCGLCCPRRTKAFLAAAAAWYGSQKSRAMKSDRRLLAPTLNRPVQAAQGLSCQVCVLPRYRLDKVSSYHRAELSESTCCRSRNASWLRDCVQGATDNKEVPWSNDFLPRATYSKAQAAGSLDDAYCALASSSAFALHSLGPGLISYRWQTSKPIFPNFGGSINPS